MGNSYSCNTIFNLHLPTIKDSHNPVKFLQIQGHWPLNITDFLLAKPQFNRLTFVRSLQLVWRWNRSSIRSQFWCFCLHQSCITWEGFSILNVSISNCRPKPGKREVFVRTELHQEESLLTVSNQFRHNKTDILCHQTSSEAWLYNKVNVLKICTVKF